MLEKKSKTTLLVPFYMYSILAGHALYENGIITCTYDIHVPLDLHI